MVIKLRDLIKEKETLLNKRLIMKYDCNAKPITFNFIDCHIQDEYCEVLHRGKYISTVFISPLHSRIGL
jgi:hypothetical protein